MFPDLEFIKTILNAITFKFRSVQSNVDAVKLDVDAVKSSPSDWNEPDTTSHGYINNKPCYLYEITGTLFDDHLINRTYLGYVADSDITFIEDNIYELYLDDVLWYSGKAYLDDQYICVGGDGYHNAYVYMYSSINNDLIWGNYFDGIDKNLKIIGTAFKWKKLDKDLYDAVTSINGESGDVTIDADRIGAAQVFTDSNNHRYVSTEGVHFYRGQSTRKLLYQGDGHFEIETGQVPNRITGVHRVIEDYDISNKKYVDDTINEFFNGTSLILPSSTSGSTKQFRITIDDSGTLTAVEIT